jgi:hypothetical protein
MRPNVVVINQISKNIIVVYLNESTHTLSYTWMALKWASLFLKLRKNAH